MKRMSLTISTLAMLFMSLGAVTSAQAAVLTISPNNTVFTNPGGAVVTIPGLPSWFQGTDGVAVGPCLDVLKCALAGSPNFAGGALSFPTNFPAESFYSLADANFTMAGASDVLVIMALEYVFVDAGGNLVNPTVAGALGSVFQRLKVVHTFTGGGGSIAALGISPTGNFTVNHPWGTTLFPAGDPTKCVNQGGDTKCTMVRDFPPTAVFTAPDSGMFTFLHDPAAPLGFLGTGLATASFTGAPIVANNRVSVTDPLGRTGTSTQLSILTGQMIGMEVQPGVDHDFGGVNMITAPAVPVTKTITVTNTTGFPINFVAANTILKTAVDPLDAADFIIGPPTQPVGAVPANCAGATLTANNATLGTVAGVCGFDITFTPVARPKAARVATINLAPTAALVANNPPPVKLSLKGTAQVTITAGANAHGTFAPDATVTPIVGAPGTFAAPAGSPVTFTAAPSNKKFKVKEVADGAALVAPSTVDPNVFTITGTNIGAVNHTVNATFMQSGDLDASGTLDVADALKALRIVAGTQQADVDDPTNTAVKVAPLDTAGKPAPLDLKANPDIGDVLVILRRVLKLDTW